MLWRTLTLLAAGAAIGLSPVHAQSNIGVINSQISSGASENAQEKDPKPPPKKPTTQNKQTNKGARDSASGLATGRRRHKPVILVPPAPPPGIPIPYPLSAAPPGAGLLGSGQGSALNSPSSVGTTLAPNAPPPPPQIK